MEHHRYLTFLKLGQTYICFCIRVGEAINVLPCVPLKSFSGQVSRSCPKNVKFVTWVRLGPGRVSALSRLLGLQERAVLLLKHTCTYVLGNWRLWPKPYMLIDPTVVFPV